MIPRTEALLSCLLAALAIAGPYVPGLELTGLAASLTLWAWLGVDAVRAARRALRRHRAPR